MNRAARFASWLIISLFVLAPAVWAQDAPPVGPRVVLEVPISQPQPPPPPDSPPPPIPLPEPHPPLDGHPLIPAKPIEAPDPLDFFGSMGRMGGMGPMGSTGPAVFAITDRTTWYPTQRVVGQGTELGFVKEALGMTIPLYREGPNSFGFSAGVGASIFNTDAVLPDSGHPFPETIWNIRFGMNYSRQFENGWTGHLGVSVGSASDRPFDAWRDVNFGFNAGLRIPAGERNAWLFTLSYSPLSQVGFPLPGVAFQWVPNDWLRMNIGVPFQLTLTPTPDWMFTASYMLLTNIHTQLSYRVLPRSRIYTGFDWNNEGYALSDRVNNRDRFFYYEKRLSVGVKTNWRQFQFDVSGGYSFDRYFAEGGTFGTHDQLTINNGPDFLLAVRYRW